ncbi:MAG: hypothetical protein PHO32_02380 [Candidatus Cloacimonetes bacterium]|nr:hypothetical protein [Candidatus Cloacimonadota bacterium]
MDYPDLLVMKDELEYRSHFINTYCNHPITSFDGFRVFFQKERFEHAFYKSANRNNIKDTFSFERAERIDWIGCALIDPSSDIRVGWDSCKKRYDKSFRVAIVVINYIVIVRITNLAKKRQTSLPLT